MISAACFYLGTTLLFCGIGHDESEAGSFGFFAFVADGDECLGAINLTVHRGGVVDLK